MRVLEAQLLGKLLTVRLADVLLQLEPFLEAASLKIRENGSSHHPPARFPARVRRPWKNQAGAGKVADAALNGARKHGASAGCARMMASGAGTSDCRRTVISFSDSSENPARYIYIYLRTYTFSLYVFVHIIIRIP